MTPFLAQAVVAVVVLIAALLLLLMGYLLWLQILSARRDRRPNIPTQRTHITPSKTKTTSTRIGKLRSQTDRPA